MIKLSKPCLRWYYSTWQRTTALYLRTWYKNVLPNNEMIGFVSNDNHPKSIKVSCDRYVYVCRYKKSFRKILNVWAHDEHSEAKLGDVVRIQPLGYKIGPWKKYNLVRIIHRQPANDVILNELNAKNKTETELV
eukprot:GHVL01032658.1.p1 GENE.GHVL01032658.1~~GHVL01032658.1.p1  ORF type:complete len:134 (-),score=14.73 GHVL01032658.1:40-441(-)